VHNACECSGRFFCATRYNVHTVFQCMQNATIDVRYTEVTDCQIVTFINALGVFLLGHSFH